MSNSTPRPSHLLIYNDPGRPLTPGGAGWLLVTVVGTRRPSTVVLAAHGADRLAEPHTAKEVAARVLRERGQLVDDWHDRSTAPPVYRAVLRGEGAEHEVTARVPRFGRHPRA